MNLTSPALKSVARVADMPDNSVGSLLQTVADHTGLLGDSPDGALGLVMSGLAGVAAALAVAIALTVYFRSRYRTTRDLVRHGFATLAVLALLAFVISDMRNAALAYLGINPAKPAVEFEIRLPRAAMTTMTDTQIELHTDRNQRLAKLQDAPASSVDGQGLLRGTVPLDYRTTERVVVLNLPGQGQCEFKLRLPANPSRSAQFGPWHLADRVGGAELHDGYAIRYRVL